MTTINDIISIIAKEYLNNKYGVKCNSYSYTTFIMYNISYEMILKGDY